MMESKITDKIELGGNISLTGFRDIDGGNMIIAKKIIGNFVKDISIKNPKFSNLSLKLKPVHKTEASQIFDLQAQMSADKEYCAEMQDRNFLFAIDKVLKKIGSQIK